MVFSPTCKFSFPTISTVAPSILGVACISMFAKSLSKFKLYSNVSGSNAGSKLKSVIFKSLRDTFVVVGVSVVTGVSSVAAPSFLIVNVYVFLVPSSAVTTILQALFPAFKSVFPLTETFAFESSALAVTVTLVTSAPTSIEYDVVLLLNLGLNPDGSVVSDARLLLLDFVGVGAGVVILTLAVPVALDDA